MKGNILSESSESECNEPNAGVRLFSFLFTPPTVISDDELCEFAHRACEKKNWKVFLCFLETVCNFLFDLRKFVCSFEGNYFERFSALL